MNFEELIVLIDAAVYSHRRKHLRDIDVLVLKESLNRKSYDQIADENNYTGQYLRQDVGPKLWNTLSAALDVKISKKSCATILETFWQKNKAIAPSRPHRTSIVTQDDLSSMSWDLPLMLTSETTKLDWGGLSENTVFYGRTQELDTLQQWIQKDTSRLIGLIGMGGMGKTTLAMKLAEVIHADFEFVMVRSMRNAPKLGSILNQFFNFVGVEPESHTANIEDAIQQCISILKKHRCLLILDNLETLLLGNTRVGTFGPNFQDYGAFFRKIADQTHQSCVMITSRELPSDIGLREGLNAPVRTLRLSGLQLSDAQSILHHKGFRDVDLSSLQEILSHYGGNPLALKIVAAGILELCEGDLERILPYLERGILQFEDIDDLVGRQFQRLDDVERQVMYWIALHRKPVVLATLEQDIIRFNMRKQLPRAVQSLCRRSLLERSSSGLFLQPVVMEYIIQRFLESLADEIIEEQYAFLQTYALLDAQAEDYIREAQQRFVLEPLLANLTDHFETTERVSTHLCEFLERLRAEIPHQPSYACGNLLNLLRQLNGHLDRLDCSKLSVWQAYLGGLYIRDINFSESDLSRSVFSNALSTTLSVCFSPDGQFFATANADNKVRVWTVKDCKQYKTYQGHSHWASAVTFCADSRQLISGSFDRSIKVWDLETGLCVDTLMGHTGWIWAVACSPENNIIASCSDDHTIRVWDLQSGQCIQVLENSGGTVWALAFSPDGEYLASASPDVAASVKLWSWKTGDVRVLIPAHLERRVRSVAFSDDGKWLATGSLACVTEVWDVETGDCVKHLRGHAQPIICVGFAPSAESESPKLLATGSQDCSLRLWDLETGTCLQTLRGHPNGVWSLAFHPNQPLLVSGSNDSTVKLWNTETGESIRTLQGYSTGIKAIALNPQGSQVACAGDNTLIHRWDLQTQQQFPSLAGHSSWVWSLAYTADGKTLVSCGNDNLIKLWNLDTGKVIRNCQGHRSLIFSLAVHDASAQIASASDDHTVRLWNLHTGQCICTLIHAGRAWSVDFSPDGHLLASGNCETLISIWDLQTQETIFTLEDHTSLVWAVDFSPDGRLLASGSDDRTAKIWDVASQTCLQTLTGHLGSIWAIAFSPDGAFVATGSNDHTIRLWDVESGQLLKTLYGHESAIWDLTFRNASELASASQEGTLKFWDLKTGHCTLTLRDTRPYEGMNLTDATGLTEAQKMSLVTLGAIV